MAHQFRIRMLVNPQLASHKLQTKFALHQQKELALCTQPNRSPISLVILAEYLDGFERMHPFPSMFPSEPAYTTAVGSWSCKPMPIKTPNSE